MPQHDFRTGSHQVTESFSVDRLEFVAIDDHGGSVQAADR